MKKILFSILLFCAHLPMHAADIKGKIVEATTNRPLDFVNVVLSAPDSETIIAGAVSDIDGNFTIPSVKNGTYRLQISFLGYHAYNRDIAVGGGKNIELGSIKLYEDSQVLGEVEVIGQGSQMRFEIDRRVFSVDQNIAAAGGSVTEVLENIPSVEVDQEGNISMRNNESVEIWINGKPAGLTADNRGQVLQQMPAESIESIELITNPSAKFNPEGTAGIINLVLKKERKAGYYGSANLGAIYSNGAGLSGNGGININYNSSHVDMYANVGYRNMKRQSDGLSKLTRFDDNGHIILTQDQNSNNSGSFHGLFLRAGIDVHINKKNTVGLSGFGMFGGGDSDNTIRYTQDNMNGVFNKFGSLNNSKNTRNNFNISLDYRHEFDKPGTDLMVNLSYSKFDGKGDNQYNYLYETPLAYESKTSQHATNDNSRIQFKVDYTNKTTETGRLELGWQSYYQRSNDEANGFNRLTNAVLPGYYNVFDYQEQVHAAYATYGERFWDKFSVQAGLRAEYLDRHAVVKQYDENEHPVTVDLPDKSYFRLFPSLYLGYSISDRDEIQLNYTRRVERPRGWRINPHRDYSDSTNVSFGNPDLMPEFSSAFELNYMKSWDNHSLSSSLYYRYTNDVIQRISYIAPQSMESTFMNVTRSGDAGLELVARNRFFRMLNLTTSLNFYYRKVNEATYKNPLNNLEEYIPSSEGFSWSGRMMANLLFSPTFSGQVTGNYSSPRVMAQGEQKARYSVDLGLRKSFFNRKFNINLMVRDLFNSRNNKSTTYGKGFERYSESRWMSRMYGVTLTYNFGNTNPKPTPRRNNNDQNELEMMNEAEE
ncbi:MAG: TonB-dependent receptor family protein [Prevotellaceae bacterium]|jgi:outer membrane receptor protein involved in Fe transport|nr:TonB-dependent receptor family protein [Prevotellaceae bacterium]